MSSVHLSRGQKALLASIAGLALTHFAFYRIGHQSGFNEGRDPYTIPVEPGKIPCDPTYGHYTLEVGDTARSVAGQFGIPEDLMIARAMDRYPVLRDANGNYDPTKLLYGMCFDIAPEYYDAATPTLIGEVVGTPVSLRR